MRERVGGAIHEFRDLAVGELALVAEDCHLAAASFVEVAIDKILDRVELFRDGGAAGCGHWAINRGFLLR